MGNNPSVDTGGFCYLLCNPTETNLCSFYNLLRGPCPGCEKRKKDQEWKLQHPLREKYLTDKGWKRIFLEEEFGGRMSALSPFLGWWHKKFCFTQQGYYMLDQAVGLQRQKDERTQPRYRQEAV